MWGSRWLTRLWSRGSTGVDSADVGALSRASRRTMLVRLVLGVLAAALVVAAAASARDLETREEGLLPRGTVGVVVLDLSLSIADQDYVLVRRALSRLVQENSRVGLVVFSDVPYELLPPGTPASEMRPMLRLLVPPELGDVVNPWTETFRAGTRVSAALELARSMLERDQVRSGSILLVSDLETAPEDVPVLARKVDELRRSSIELRVVGLAPSSDARLIFDDLLQSGVFAPTGSSEDELVSGLEASKTVPVVLLVLGALLFAALAAHEAFGVRLAIPGGARRAS